METIIETDLIDNLDEDYLEESSLADERSIQPLLDESSSCLYCQLGQLDDEE